MQLSELLVCCLTLCFSLPLIAATFPALIQVRLGLECFQGYSLEGGGLTQVVCMPGKGASQLLVWWAQIMYLACFFYLHFSSLLFAYTIFSSHRWSVLNCPGTHLRNKIGTTGRGDLAFICPFRISTGMKLNL